MKFTKFSRILYFYIFIWGLCRVGVQMPDG